MQLKRRSEFNKIKMRRKAHKDPAHKILLAEKK